MKLEELRSGQYITVMAATGGRSVELDTVIEEVNKGRHTVYASPIVKDGKTVSFSVPGLSTHIVINFENKNPHVFRNVKVLLCKKDKTKNWYAITSSSGSVEINRRKTPRCYIGYDTVIRVGPHRTTYNGTIKDVSAGGFGFTLSSDKPCPAGSMVRLVLNDTIPEISERFSFSLCGIIVNQRMLENGKMLYGCRLTSQANGLKEYIAKKEKSRTHKSRK